MRKLVYIAAAAAVVAGSSSAFAAQANDAFQVKVQINKRCDVTAPDIDFGALDEVLGTESAASTVIISCSKGAAYNLSLTSATTAPWVTSQTGLSMAGAIVGNTDTIPYDLELTGSVSGTGLGLGTAQQLNATLTADLTSADSGLTPDSYVSNKTLYINY